MKQYKIVIVMAGHNQQGESELNMWAKQGWEILNMSTMDSRGWIIYTLVKLTFDKK